MPSEMLAGAAQVIAGVFSGEKEFVAEAVDGGMNAGAVAPALNGRTPYSYAPASGAEPL